jgi:hypothetical protein
MAVSTDHYESMKSRAQAKVQTAVKRGKIPPAKTLNCVDCGAPAFGYDHRDYTKPLQVDAVCRRCNLHRGPAVNAPPDLRRDGQPFKSIKTHANGGGLRLQSGASAYIDIADFPGHCLIDIDDRLIECYEITARSQTDPDVHSYIDEIIKGSRAKKLSACLHEKNLPEIALTSNYKVIGAT